MCFNSSDDVVVNTTNGRYFQDIYDINGDGHTITPGFYLFFMWIRSRDIVGDIRIYKNTELISVAYSFLSITDKTKIMGADIYQGSIMAAVVLEKGDKLSIETDNDGTGGLCATIIKIR